MTTPPTLHRRGDRSYSLTGPNVGIFRQFIEASGWKHYSPYVGDLFLHRWVSPDKTTVAVMFPSHSISVLGPRFALFDELVECAPVESTVAK